MAPCNESTLALLYAIFTMFFVVTNYSSQAVGTQSRIYQSVVKRYISMPWSYEPTKYLEQVQTSEDLFTWLRTVFITVTFADQPTNGKGDYCTTLYQCDETQGDCNNDNQCLGDYTCGDKTAIHGGVEVNGVYWALDDLVRWCNWVGTPIYTDTEQGWQTCVQNTRAVGHDLPECCIDPNNDMYITKLDFYRNESVPVVSSNCPSFMSAGFSCCAREHPTYPARNLSSTSSVDNAPVREATVGSFNRIIGIRLGMKRFKTVERDKRTKWRDLYPYALAGRGDIMSPSSANGNVEDQAKFCNNVSGACYEYSFSGSYLEAGYYTEFLDPADGEVGARNLLERLRRDQWFSLEQGVFVADIFTFNGNEDTDTFAHSAFIFQFDFAGHCVKSQSYQTFNLNYFNFAVTKYATRFFCELCLLLFVFLFFFLESLNMKTNFWAYFKASNLVDLASLILCTVVLVGNWLFQTHPMFGEFNFDDLQNPDTRGATFARLEEVADLFSIQTWLVAFNMLMLLLRAISMASTLHANLGLMLKVIDAGFYNLLYFFLMFIMIMMGFVFFAFFIFGADYLPMSDWFMCFFEVFSMIFGNKIYVELEKADETMAPIFFYSFYVLFYLVMLNMFVSIIMSGYDIVVDKLEENKGLKNPFWSMVSDVSRDIFGKVNFVFGFFFSGLKMFVSPVIQVLTDCFCRSSISSMTPKVQVPGSISQFLGRKQEEAEVIPNENDEDDEVMSNEDGVQQPPAFPKMEFCCMLVFMINFVMFSYFQVRGVATYTMVAATHSPVTEAKWVTDNPKRNMKFGQLSSFEDVYPWALAAIVPLYSHPVCAVFDETTRENYLRAGGDCNSTNDKEQLVNVVNGWNIGFMRSTFVRVTVVPSCFRFNEDPTWKEGYSMVRQPPTVDSVDPEQGNSDGECRTFGGEKVDIYSSPHNWSEPERLGPVGRSGGYAVSLGLSQEQCKDKLEELYVDRFFTKNTASMVFDWVMYNGNLDMFTYNSVQFVLQNSGYLSVSTAAQAFPLNMEEGGGSSQGERLAGLALLVVYIIFVGYYVLELGLKLASLAKDQGSSVSPYRVVLDYFSDYWHISDTISLLVSIVLILIYAMYFANVFRKPSGGYNFSVDATKGYPIPNADAKSLDMAVESDPRRVQEEDWYVLMQFETIQGVYYTLLTCAGLNSFFIAIKTVKYVGMLPKVQVFSKTMAEGKVRITYFLVIILMQMLGFALFISVIFGPTKGDNSLDHPISAALALFDWIVGTPDLQDYIRRNAVVAVITFVLYMLQFYFISLQLFLATMLNTYATEMGKKDKKREKDAVEAKKSLRVVEYADVNEFKADVTLAHPTEMTEEQTVMMTKPAGKNDDKIKRHLFVVESVKRKGKAARFNVQKEHIVVRVNGKQDFLQLDSLEKLFLEMERFGKVLEVTFKEKKLNDSLFLHTKKDDDVISATVKNLWASCGAVTWVYNQVEQEERVQESGGTSRNREVEVQDADAEESDAEEEPDPEDDDQRDQTAKVKIKAKKRLESLLFSRWVDRNGRREATDHDTCPMVTEGKRATEMELWKEPVGGKQVKDKTQEDQGSKKDDKDFLKSHMEKQRVTGEEVWLDVLITAIEREMDNRDFSLIPEVLRSVDQQDGEQEGGAGSIGSTGINLTLKQNVNMVLKVLEYKAKKQYYDQLRKESEEHVHRLDLQNQYLHEYVWELETEFAKIMTEIHDFKGKKDALLRRLAGVLDREEYKDLEVVRASP